jgi:hypothetical protein
MKRSKIIIIYQTFLMRRLYVCENNFNYQLENLGHR